MNMINHIINIPVQIAGESICGNHHFEARHIPDAPEIWHYLVQAVCIT